jgi:hypothetical protein
LQASGNGVDQPRFLKVEFLGRFIKFVSGGL